MRPRLIWRVLDTALAPVWAFTYVGNPILRIGGFILCVGFALAAWRDYSILANDVVYQRGWLRWQRPLLLSQVTEVELHYVTWVKDLPHRELWLYTDERGAFLNTFSLRWWSNWRPFVGQIVDALSDPPSDSFGERTWHVKVDEKSRRRLERIAVETKLSR